jgi:hypothetical protein
LRQQLASNWREIGGKFEGSWKEIGEKFEGNWTELGGNMAGSLRKALLYCLENALVMLKNLGDFAMLEWGSRRASLLRAAGWACLIQ